MESVDDPMFHLGLFIPYLEVDCMNYIPKITHVDIVSILVWDGCNKKLFRKWPNGQTN